MRSTISSVPRQMQSVIQPGAYQSVAYAVPEVADGTAEHGLLRNGAMP